MSLRRDLGLLEATTIIIGSMIGSGIFLGVDVAARLVPHGPTLLLVFLAGGILSLLGALTYGELASVLPESGGAYAYIRDAYGRLPGFLQGWALFTITKSASVAALAVAFAVFLGALVPMGAVATKVVAVGVIAALTLANMVGVRYAGIISNVSAFAKVGALVLLVGVGVLLAGGATPTRADVTLPTGWGLVAALGAATVPALFAYDGWINSTQVAEEVRDPERNVPRSLVLGVVIVTTVYLAVVGVYLLTLGSGGMLASDFAAADTAAAFGGDLGRTLVVVAVLVSIFGTINAVILSGPRIYYAMARDGLFPRRLAEVHPTWGTPVWSIGLQGVWSALLALSGTFDQLLTAVIFVSWVFYGLGAFIVLKWRRERPDAPRAYRVPAYPWVPLLVVAGAAVLTVSTLLTLPVWSLLGTGIVLLGLPVYALMTRADRDDVPQLPISTRDLSREEKALLTHLGDLEAEGRAWDTGEAARVLRVDKADVYRLVSTLSAHTGGRVQVGYDDGLQVRLVDV